MSSIRVWLAVPLLAGAFVVAPTTATGASPSASSSTSTSARAFASPRPVSPSITELAIPAVSPTSAAPGRTTAARLRTFAPFDVAGVTFRGTAPKNLVVEARTAAGGVWGDWIGLDIDETGPDRGTVEARRARHGTEVLLAAGADAIDIRVTSADGSAPAGLTAALIDSGTSPADAATPLGGTAASAAVARPAIVTRAQWGADESLRTCEPYMLPGRIKAAVVHHTVNSNTYTADQAASLIRGIYAYHTQSRGWCDVGYQFIVDRFGRIYEGRKGSLEGNVRGAHAEGFNIETVGVSALGEHSTTQPTTAALAAFARVIAWKADVNYWDPRGSTRLVSAGTEKFPAGASLISSRILGHRDLNYTACPGDTLYSKLQGVRTAAASIWTPGRWTSVASRTVQESFARPAGTTMTLAGRGYGHGRGMSQWGAYGAAQRGLTWNQIASFYYPGTAVKAQGNPTLRVRLTELGTAGTTVPKQSGLVMRDGRTTIALSSGPSRWRVIPDGGGVTLQWWASTGWASSTAWKAWKNGPLTFATSSGVVQVITPDGSLRTYRGSIGTLPWGTVAISVNSVDTESYLRSVVPAEMPASWHTNALRAQAVAARTYAAWGKGHSPSVHYDTCDSTSCQVYRGINDRTSAGTLKQQWEQPASSAAVTATAGSILTYGGTAAFTEFSASNGGRTAAGAQPYLPLKADPYDGVVASPSNPHTWSLSVPITTIEAAYPSTGRLRELVVTGRSGGGAWDGRATGVRVVGSTGSTAVSADSFRSTLRLRSTWWGASSVPPVSAPAHPRDLTADGRSDGVVLSGPTLYTVAYTGSMAFSLSSRGATGWAGRTLISGIGPFDQDNLGDLISRDSSGRVWLRPGTVTSAYTRPETQIASGWGSVNLVVTAGDVNRDGYNDVITRSADTLALHRGDGTGRIVASTVISGAWGRAGQIVGGDFDGNGSPDLIAVTASGAVSFHSNLGGTFAAPRAVVTSEWQYARDVRSIGDVTGDGRDDIVVVSAVDGSILVHPVTGSAVIGAGIVAGSWKSSVGWGY